MIRRLSHGLAVAVMMSCVMAGAAAASDPILVTVPSVTIYPGDTISEGALVDRQVRITGGRLEGYKLNRTDLTGRIARRTLIAGHLVPADAIREPFAVNQGQVVRLVFVSGPLTITGLGTLLQAGSVGSIVKVRNDESGIEVTGRVMADGTVAVDGR
jgi:flagella basal body P-ring formation protein FlgA